MNHIKNTFLLVVILLLVFSCTKDDETSAPKVPAFVRFNFLANSNNQPLEFPEVTSGLIPKSDFTNTSIKTLKVPVTLTSETLQNSITVDYSVNINGDNTLFSLNPANQVSFQGNQLTDTIYVSFNERWIDNQNIVLKLESVSDPSVTIGNLNSTFPNDTFSIDLGEINTTFTFPENRIEIIGEAGEEIEFEVNFPNGYITSEIENQSIFSFLDGFDYTLTKILENETGIIYKITLNDDIQNDDVFYQTLISLNDTENYTSTGNKTLQIVKPIKTEREVSVNTASNFYNLGDPFYRTYGETWNDFNNDGICQWNSYTAFTYPIVVSKDDANAVLYDDMGTADPSDDIYHDAFKIGFKTPNAVTTTTNSFNLKRWFNNESISGLNSPGFDINPALEFFPENGNSTTNGRVLIIPQFITIAGRNGNSYSFAISGEGTYEEISKGIFELKFQLNLTNDEVLGGTVTADYRLYNTNSYTDPEDLTTTDCVTEYTL
jgi:hypothetical protein